MGKWQLRWTPEKVEELAWLASSGALVTDIAEYLRLPATSVQAQLTRMRVTVPPDERRRRMRVARARQLV